MFTLPLLTYFASRRFLFSDRDEPDNWAGGAAILVTNVIVAGYCYAAYVEDAEERGKDDGGKADSYDADRPRVGIYKQRTD